MSIAKTIGRGLLYIAFNLFVACAIIEGIIVTMLHAPGVTAASPAPVRRLVQQVYRHFNRALIQFEPICARYDPDVSYTLRPGTCTFGNVEFVNTYRVNRLGLRDDDADLAGPDVIVLGDSHAMGWGVEQDQSFPRVLARRSGLKVLNAAVSSYATVREMRMLDRLDTSRLKVLVIQYADNDQPENRAFRDGHNHLTITGQAEYQTIVDHYAAQRSYYPGKYVWRLFMKVTRLEKAEPDQLKMEVLPPEVEAELFLNALEHAGRTPLDGVQVVALEVNQELSHPRAFIAALAQVAPHDPHPPFVRRLLTFDTTAVLKDDDFYVLDDHMNAKGHDAVGSGLAAVVQKALAEFHPQVAVPQ
jgi:hypothetical protein